MSAARLVGRGILRRLPVQARKPLSRRLPDRFVGWYRRERVDAYLVSFQKSGRTWLRVMLGRALQLHYELPESANLIELHRLAELDASVPCIVATHDSDAVLRPANEYRLDVERFGGRPIILLVRDPRDVIVSWYHHRRNRDYPYEGSLDEFLHEPVGSFDSLLAFGSSWAAQLDADFPVLLVRYEDIHADPESELRRVLAFVGVEASGAVVADAVRFGSFDNMRRLEEADAFGTDKLRPARPGDYATYKTRRGRVGSYEDELTPEQIADLDRRMARANLARFGYNGGAWRSPTGSGPASPSPSPPTPPT